jgi:penicillin-binding protein 2
VCFAPRENPKIAVAVIVENAGFGATWAGPMAGLVMEKFLKDTLSEARWKEVERIENTEIILPIVRAKRNRLDSLRKDRIKKIQSRAIAMNPASPTSSEKLPVQHTVHAAANLKKDEEQVI